MSSIDTSEARALALDEADPLRGCAAHFPTAPGGIYLLGNSLGLMCGQAERALEDVTRQWRELAIEGWFAGDRPWIDLAEQLGATMAPLMGAEPDEVVATGSTTVNLHALLSGFYQPAGARRKILADALNFPSDLYALQSHLRLRGLDPAQELLLAEPGPDGLLDEGRLIEMMDDEVALVLLPSVLYRSGQLLDVGRLCAAAHARGSVIGIDCAHSAGVLRHQLSAWGVDFAVWCGYKYLCGGPGATAFLYLGRRHAARATGMAGWFGFAKARQFDMLPDFEQQPGAAGWQISSPPILSAAPLLGSLGLITEAGLDRIEEKSRRITGYLMELARALLCRQPYSFALCTPVDPDRRGGHVALAREQGAAQLQGALARRGIVADVRPGGTLRLCPAPLYTSYHQVWRAVHAIAAIIDAGEHLGEPTVGARSP